MEWLKNKKTNYILANMVYPLILWIYSFWNVNEGVDLMDVGYNYGNFVFWDQLSNTWKLGTYLANELGRFFYRLPMGDTLLGMNLYTTSLIGIMALLAYFFARRYVAAGYAFLGNLLAISLCWCPTAKLYDYLTYLLMMIGILLLFYGLSKEKRRYLILAGIVLGVNIFTRFSNLAEAGFILLVWYYAWIKKKGFREGLRMTGWCALGYSIGIALMLVIVSHNYGMDAYISMMAGMAGIESTTSDYSALDLITGAWRDYLRSLKWVMFYGIYILAGVLFFRLVPSKKKGVSSSRAEWIKKICFLAGMPVLYRFFWGRGMFDLNYYSYGAIFWPAVLFLVWSILVCFIRLKKGPDMAAMLVLLIILLTPMGSNNRSYSIMNDLFLIAPFVFAWSWELLREKCFPLKSTILIFLLFLMVQSIGFGLVFTFGDGSYAEKRNTKIEKNDILSGMYTSAARAQALEKLTVFCESLPGEHSAVTYGNIPALCYYLGIEPAMGSTWPDLKSYSMQEFKQDFLLMEKHIKETRPFIILNGELDEEDHLEEKYLLIEEFMEKHAYRLRFSEDNLLVFY